MLSKAFDLGGPAERIVNFTYDYNPTNRLWISHDSLSDLHGGTSYRGLTYDSRGNMTGLGPLQMSYDLSDQMISTGGWASGISWTNGTFQYNGEGKRVQMTMNTASGGSAATGRNTFYVYDHAGRLVLSHKEHDGEGVERLYLESGEALAKWTGTELTYLHSDHLGTPIRGRHGMGGTKTVGTEVFQDFGTPFGAPPVHGWHGTAGSGFSPATGPGSNCGVTGFTTHMRDCETGLQYMQARYMDPVISRFTSIDPVEFLTDGRTGMVNRYGYALNDPINMFDPDGENPLMKQFEENMKEMFPPPPGFEGENGFSGVTVAVGVEYDNVGGQSSAGGGTVGAFVSVETDGSLSAGAFTTDKVSEGVDLDISVTGSVMAGGSEHLAGGSVSGEIDGLGVNNLFGRAGLTLEGGVTDSGRPIVGAELSLGILPGGIALNDNETTIHHKVDENKE